MWRTPPARHPTGSSARASGPHSRASAAQRTVVSLARLQDPAFADWVEGHVAFPNSMVDCITPATSERERQLVADRFGIIDAAPVACEPFRQWVLEAASRPGVPLWSW